MKIHSNVKFQFQGDFTQCSFPSNKPSPHLPKKLKREKKKEKKRNKRKKKEEKPRRNILMQRQSILTRTTGRSYWTGGRGDWQKSWIYEWCEGCCGGCAALGRWALSTWALQRETRAASGRQCLGHTPCGALTAVTCLQWHLSLQGHAHSSEPLWGCPGPCAPSHDV